jgi:hypothetical protein
MARRESHAGPWLPEPARTGARTVAGAPVLVVHDPDGLAGLCAAEQAAT